MSSSNESIVGATTRRIFADLGDPRSINQARDDGWRQALWSALEEAGLTRAWIPEAFGGAGASLADGFEVLRVAGQFACPVALGETLLAGWILSRAGQECPPGAMSVAPMRSGHGITMGGNGRLSGTACSVPYAQGVDALVVVADHGGRTHIALVEPRNCRSSEQAPILDGSRVDFSFDDAAPIAIFDAPLDFDQQSVMLMGAVVRSVQIAGALESILELTVEYAKDRFAFERPLAKFQAVQHNLARLAGEVAAALAVSGSAADAVAHAERLDEAGLFLEAASAKIRVGEAAGEVARIAHQVHGAIGFTAEYVLQRYTRQAWVWRDDFDTESHWARRLGELVASQGADDLWPMLAAR